MSGLEKHQDHDHVTSPLITLTTVHAGGTLHKSFTVDEDGAEEMLSTILETVALYGEPIVTQVTTTFVNSSGEETSLDVTDLNSGLMILMQKQYLFLEAVKTKRRLIIAKEVRNLSVALMVTAFILGVTNLITMGVILILVGSSITARWISLLVQSRAISRDVALFNNRPLTPESEK